MIWSNVDIKAVGARPELMYRIDVVPASACGAIEHLHKRLVAALATETAKDSRYYRPALGLVLRDKLEVPALEEVLSSSLAVKPLWVSHACDVATQRAHG